MNNILSIGSVIKVRNSNKKYIIIGQKVEHKKLMYDYACVLYPYGLVIDKSSIYYFNDNCVEYVDFLGNINY